VTDDLPVQRLGWPPEVAVIELQRVSPACKLRYFAKNPCPLVKDVCGSIPQQGKVRHDSQPVLTPVVGFTLIGVVVVGAVVLDTDDPRCVEEQ
jgi:hypothetical protein